MSAFIWLASYPKSGNTWIRAFLSSVRKNGGPISISKIDGALQPSSRHFLDDFFGIATSDLTEREILGARRQALVAYSAQNNDIVICKAHDAWINSPSGSPLFPDTLTQASIYIVRDPRDVAISLANHLGWSVDRTIDFMADPAAALSHATAKQTINTVQPLLTWSQHVESWLDKATPPPLLIRYEDMLVDPVRYGAKIAEHIGCPREKFVYEEAVRYSSFEELQKQERSAGFIEASAADRVFFRSGKAGTWRETLTPDQIARIENDHGSVMARLGYLS